MTIRRLIAVSLLVAVLFPLNGRAEDKLVFSGDIRGRAEGFRYSQDETGSKKARRFRMRYRLRLNAKATVNEYATFQARVGTGTTDNRSGNITLGGMVDFGPDAFGIRQAYFTVSPFKYGKFNEDKGMLGIDFGRVKNPFIWKNGEDKMLWDSDINLSGASVRSSHQMGDGGEVFGNLGYYTLEENSSDKDPFMAAAQVGATGKLAGTSSGVRGTFYRFDRLTPDFIRRGVDGSDGSTDSAGNIEDGLTGNPMGGQMNVIEGTAFVELLEEATWPVVVFGGASHNLDAVDSEANPEVKASSNAFNLGAHAGNKKKVVQIGFSYYHIEANAFPSMFIDSDVLDGVTNRRGLTGFLSKDVMKSTNFKFTALMSDAIETADGYLGSNQNSERFRYQIDLSLKF